MKRTGTAFGVDRLTGLFVLVPHSFMSDDDWHRSLKDTKDTTTPRVFPVDESPNTNVQDDKGNRTLSELLRLHSEKDSKGNFSPEEASRIADVLGQWVGVHSRPMLELDPDLA
jgi:hypothetical protein